MGCACLGNRKTDSTSALPQKARRLCCRKESKHERSRILQAVYSCGKDHRRNDGDLCDHGHHPVCGLRRCKCLSGPARRHDCFCLHPGSSHFYGRDPRPAQEELHSGEQHGADHRFRRREPGRRCHLHHARTVPVGKRGSVRQAQHPGDHPDRPVRRHSGRSVHGAPAQRPDRQGARHPAVPGRHRLCRRSAGR